MDYLTLKDRIKCYYTMKMILAYLFNIKQISKQKYFTPPLQIVCKKQKGTDG